MMKSREITGYHYSSKVFVKLFTVLTMLTIDVETINAQSYDMYHHMISEAEEYYFLAENADSCLSLYQRCFENFDFVFARDAINALQIAYKENRTLDFFLIQAIESGITPANISTIPALRSFAKDSLPKMDVMKDYDLHRSQYLERISLTCLNQLYWLGITEQLEKDKKGKNETSALFKLASEFGLPGEKNCGIENPGILKELGNEAFDFMSLRDSLSVVKGREIRHYTLNGNALIMHIPLVIMLHDYCTYKDYKESFHDAYLGGFIHPREIGCIYDNAFRGNTSDCLMVPNIGIFGLNIFVNSSDLNVKLANELRAKWGICSVQTDRKKKALIDKGYKFIWDYW